MPSEQYELLKKELPCIAKQVAAFPEGLQSTVYRHIMEALLNQEIVVSAEDVAHLETAEGAESSKAEGTSTESRNYVSEILEYYTRYNMSSRNDMEVAAFAAYYFTQVAPSANRVEVIGGDQYIDLCKVTGRKLPKSAQTTLNNAKNRKGYLETRGTGVYALTDAGEHFVRHTLLKESVE